MIVKQSRANKWGRQAGHVLLKAAGFFNPYFAPGVDAGLREALYRDWLTKSDDPRAEAQRARLGRLRGKVLVCTCDLEGPCFCRVLDGIANDAGRGEAGCPETGAVDGVE